MSTFILIMTMAYHGASIHSISGLSLAECNRIGEAWVRSVDVQDWQKSFICEEVAR